ncbi:MAG: 2-aminoethylphosphonate--pyruvate transaminase [Pirellulaceae bacterium]|nr:2-aminoethylphosphonate--pyruvate transaminase [Planctomycetales bacterium]
MSLPAAHDKPLFTPGPLTTSATIKQAMLRDLGSRDVEFIAIVRAIRSSLLEIAGVSTMDGYEAILMQGSGTFGIESVLSSTIPRDGKLLVIANGAYGERIAKMAAVLQIPHTVLRCAEDTVPAPDEVRDQLGNDPQITDVAVVHCETTTGIINPVTEIGFIAGGMGKRVIVDSMSGFGAIPLDLRAASVDYLISSANKCLEGVPGFSFVVCRRTSLEASDGNARSLSLDLLAQWRGLETNGQFRFTPPTHAILAFHQALVELAQEGGIAARAQRYQQNYRCLVDGMAKLGFEEYLPRDLQGYIITSFRYPEHPQFDFEQFYSLLNERGFVIYPGKVSNADCFRIGNIGRLFPSDVRALLGAIADSIAEMGVTLPVTSAR